MTNTISGAPPDDMLNEKLLEQYAELMGYEGMSEMYEAFAENIGGYLALLRRLFDERDYTESKRQAHKMKGACRSVGLKQLASRMEYLERESWNWDEASQMIEQWATELPLHQLHLKRWLNARRI
ncbi:Hpt domain-containing protein [Pseudidiomarina sp.]|uniref:Hpt domain-containing protein n=1 Tax=Pseudidiomarina sp. TaxID=2081707 RepID=UPI00299DCF55|nr:Hpt domain-containing protein [Pseudidiomarina sp.]MDX1705295.1 Hpt domain-containing protein [Pseudidiomarina sp.]